MMKVFNTYDQLPSLKVASELSRFTHGGSMSRGTRKMLQGRGVLFLTILHLSHYIVSGCNVAIIGAGVGGSAAAYYLRKQKPDCSIQVFERGSVGGRVKEFTYKGKVLELGASIIHGWNRYMLTAAKELNLTAVQGDDTGSSFSVFDGKSFVYSQEDGFWGTVAALRRYGVAPLRYARLSMNAGERFGGIYELQLKGGRCYRSPDELLQALGLLELTDVNAIEYAKSQLTWLFSYGAERFMEELAGAVNRVNYNQRNANMNAFAALVSYLPAAEPEVYSIKGGNSQVAQKMLQAAAPLIKLESEVTQVLQLEDGHWQLTTEPPAGAAAAGAPAAGATASQSAGEEGCDLGLEQGDGSTPAAGSSSRRGSSSSSSSRESLKGGEGGETGAERRLASRREDVEASPRSAPAAGNVHGPFDSVIIAAPLEGSNISFAGFILPPLPPRPYQITVTSFIEGALNPGYFKVEAVPDGDVLVTSDADTPFSVLALKELQPRQHAAAGATAAAAATTNGSTSGSSGPSKGGSGLWKVFSQAVLTEQQLAQLFVNHSVIKVQEWKAYPKYHAPESLPPFLLAPGLVYNNALEASASAMEVALVAAYNSVLLVTQPDTCTSTQAE